MIWSSERREVIFVMMVVVVIVEGRVGMRLVTEVPPSLSIL